MAGAPEGNKNAVKERRMITSALTRAVAQNPDKLKKACEKVLEDAAAGNLAAFNTMADRLDGKAAQAITHEGEVNYNVTKILLGELNDDSDS